MHSDISSRFFEKVTLEDLDRVAEELTGLLKDYSICILNGSMGSGKTTLVKALCRAVGVEDVTGSPTYSIVNEYLTNDNTKVFHFDFYRVRSEAEAFDIGSEEYFYSGYRCFIEWAEKIPSLLPDRYAIISISIDDPLHRTIALTFHG